MKMKIHVDEYDPVIEELIVQVNAARQKYIFPLEEKIAQLKTMRADYLIRTKTYGTFPLSDEYKLKDVAYIEFITEDGKTEYWFCDNNDIFEIDGQGYPQYSGMEIGLLYWDEETQSFIYAQYGDREQRNYIGYSEIIFADEEPKL